MEMDCNLKIFLQVPPVNFVEIAKKKLIIVYSSSEKSFLFFPLCDLRAISC